MRLNEPGAEGIIAKMIDAITFDDTLAVSGLERVDVIRGIKP